MTESGARPSTDPGQPSGQRPGIAFADDGRLLASAGRDRTVRLWDPGAGCPVGAPLAGHREAVEAVAFADNGLLVSADR